MHPKQPKVNDYLSRKKAQKGVKKEYDAGMNPVLPDAFPLRARVQTLNGHLVVYVPLDRGGRQLASVTRGLSDIEGADLKIVIPEWLAQEIDVQDGTDISIDCQNGQFRLTRITHSGDY